MTTDNTNPSYPVTFEVDYPEKQSRLKALFRFILIIPVMLWIYSFEFMHFVNEIIAYFNLYVVTNKLTGLEGLEALNFMDAHHIKPAIISLGITVAVPVILLILFRKKYPQWIFTFNTGYFAFSQRLAAYFWCLTDTYPNSDQESSVRLHIDYPQTGQLLRFMPFVKWILAIPHYFCLIALFVCLVVLGILSWIAVVFTGKYPKGMHDFNVGVLRWSIRVVCYMALLTTDKYPPFSLK